MSDVAGSGEWAQSKQDRDATAQTGSDSPRRAGGRARVTTVRRSLEEQNAVTDGGLDRAA